MRNIFLLLILSNCAHRPAPPPAAKKLPPPSKRVAKRTGPAEELADVKGVVQKRGKTPTFASDFKRGPCTFGKIPIVDPEQAPIYNFAPATLCAVKGKTYMSSFPEDWYHYEWTNALIVEKSRTVVAVMDYGIEGGMESVPVFRSQNGGKSWMHLGEIQKPHFAARIVSLSFPTVSKGSAVIEWNDKDKYIAETKDGGKTWSAPYLVR